MTTLVGLHHTGRGTWIGADCRVSSEYMKIGPVQKWVRYGRWGIGCAGDYKTICLLRADTKRILSGASSPEDIAAGLEQMMVRNNYASSASEGAFGPPIWGQSFLVASDKGLWELDATLSLFPVPDGVLWAAGSGRDFAMGAGWASTAQPHERVRLAVEASCTYDPMSGHGGWFDHIDHIEVRDETRDEPTKKRKAG